MKIRLHEATRDDSLRLAHFLKKRADTCMFMRANLQNYGIGQSDYKHAMRYFLREQGGQIVGVGAISNSGMVMVQAEEAIADIAAFMQTELGAADVAGFLGESGMITEMRAALGLADREAGFDEKEPLFSLDLADLVIPVVSGATLRKACGVDMTRMLEWTYDYRLETGLMPTGEDARAAVKQEVLATLKRGNTRQLIHKGKVVAKTAFNAELPDMVQVGGVYTPPEFRNRGYARLAVALHLEEARNNGVERAILFASGEAAARAYRAIGFGQIGHYTITIF